MLAYFLTSKYLCRVDATLAVMFSSLKQEKMKRKLNIIILKLMSLLRKRVVSESFSLKHYVVLHKSITSRQGDVTVSVLQQIPQPHPLRYRQCSQVLIAHGLECLHDCD